MKSIKGHLKRLLRRARHDDVLYTLLEIGIGTLAIAAPTIAIAAVIFAKKYNQGRFSRKRLGDSFYYLKRKGFLHIESWRGETLLTLTAAGKAKAGLLKLLEGRKKWENKKWDGMWRVVLFDVVTEKRAARDALRLLLKRLGFVLMQRSVWVLPWDCREEVAFMRDFFLLKEHELRLITTSDIGNDAYFRRQFRL